eukprot:3145003-Pleurochrysis_carterae.AAC.2
MICQANEPTRPALLLGRSLHAHGQDARSLHACSHPLPSARSPMNACIIIACGVTDATQDRARVARGEADQLAALLADGHVLQGAVAAGLPRVREREREGGERERESER